MARKRRFRVAGWLAFLTIGLAPIWPWPAGAVPASGLKEMKVIVIDPGHGGLDSGAKGKFGILEKDITLAISLKLSSLIEQNLAFRVILTRDKDVNLSLENRSAVANNNDAVLFISIHTNGSFRNKAQGAETYFLNLNATDEETRKLAYMENSAAELEKRIAEDDKNDVKLILWDMAQAAYIKQSGKLAEIIQQELNELLGIENRGIKQAPFKVLTGVACPAILVETAFISNPQEEQKLANEEFQTSVAKAIYTGLAKYMKLYGQS